MQQAQHKFIDIDGINVHYIDAGEGPPVLLLHGLGTSLVTWHCNVVPLVDAGYRVLALDLPGHGDSDKPRTLSYDPVNAVRVVHRFLELQGVDQTTLVGNSAGGLIGGLYAVTHPERVSRVVLVASGGLGRQVCWFLRIASLPWVGELLYRPSLRNAIDLSKHIFFQEPPVLGEVLPEMYRVRNLPGARHAAIQSVRSSINLWGLRKQRQILHRLTQLSIPLLTVWGAEDNIIPVEHALEVERLIPNSIVCIIPQCGHWPHMERAEEFNDLLVRFISKRLDNGQHPAA